MSITLLTQPITGADGTYENVFPSRGRCEFTFNRKDAVITSITSGVDNKVRIASSTDFTDLEVGDFVTWTSDAYTLKSSRVISVININTIEVDFVFSSTNVLNGWVNFKDKWYLEARFVDKDSTSDDQTALEALSNVIQTTNSKNGDTVINCNLIADLITPTLNLSDPAQPTFQTEFKIQYRESWSGNREEDWVSPSPDVSILFIHGSKELNSSGYIDNSGYTRKFWRGYPLFFSYVHSKVNDLDVNTVKLIYEQFNLGKSSISTTEAMSKINFNGLAIGKIETSALNENTAFIRFSDMITSNKYQYDPTQYDPTQYA